MAFASRRPVGLAVTPRRIVVAQRASRAADIVAEVIFDETANLENPQALGARLHEAMRRSGMTARSAVIGLPARWIMTRRHEIPALAQNALAQMMRLTADRLFAIDARELVVDYVPPHMPEGVESAGPDNGNAATGKLDVLLAATLRRRVDQVVAVARAARLKPLAVTPACAVLAASLAEVHAPEEHHVSLIMMTDDGAALCTLDRGRLAALQHIQTPSSSLSDIDRASWLDTLGRTLAVASDDAAAGSGSRLIVCGVEDADASAISDRLPSHTVIQANGPGAPPAIADVAEAGGNGAVAVDAPAVRQAALALATSGVAGSAGVDWIHSRLAAPSEPSLIRRWRGVALVAAVTLIAIAAPLYLLQQRRSQVDDLAGELAALQQPAQDARSLVEKVEYAERWFENRPRILEAIRALTLAFPLSGDTWATEITWRDDMVFVVNGKSVDQRNVLELSDRLQGSPAFENAKVLYIRASDREQREFAFAIALRCRPALIARAVTDSTLADTAATDEDSPTNQTMGRSR